MRWRYFYFFLLLFVIIADQSTKFIVSKTLINIEDSERNILGFLKLRYVLNRGVIFGFFSQSGKHFVYILLTLASVLAIILVVYYFFKTPSSEKIMKISLSLILGGALGNLIDRLIRGYVIDFLTFRFWPSYPSFNVADASITIGAILLILVLFRGRRKCTHSY